MVALECWPCTSHDNQYRKRKRPTESSPPLRSIHEEALPRLTAGHPLSSAQFHRVIAAARANPRVFEACFITAALILYRRYLATVDCDGTSIPLTLPERLRAFVVAYMVAMKVCDDDCVYTNEFAAYVSPTRTHEALCALLECERAFCEALDWNLHVCGDAFDALVDLVEDDVVNEVIHGR